MDGILLCKLNCNYKQNKNNRVYKNKCYDIIYAFIVINKKIIIDTNKYNNMS